MKHEQSEIERLLAQAGEWTPDRPCPGDLVSRAAARSRRPSLPIFRFAPTLAMACAAGLFLIVRNLSPLPATPGPQRVFSQNTPIVEIEPTSGADDLPANPGRSPESPQLAASAPSKIVRPQRRVVRSRPPVASWAVEEVRSTVSGVISEGWILQPAAERGEVTLVPGVLHSPAVMTADQPGVRQPVIPISDQP